MALQAEAPSGVLHAGVDAGGHVGGLNGAIHGLQKPVLKLAGGRHGVQVKTRLGPHQFELLAAGLNPLGARLGAHAQPVNAGRGPHRAVGLHGNAKTARMQGINQGGVDLHQWLATGQHRQAMGVVSAWPLGCDAVGQRVGLGKFATQGAVGADKISVAKPAHGSGTVALAAAPQVAARKAAKHRGHTGLAAFTL